MTSKSSSSHTKASHPVIVIVGPTASGKTSLSIDLAEKYGGEIISADSRAIYQYMDIGTAKPTPEEQARVQHWGVDIVDPSQRFTVHDFQKYACEKIADIRSRGKQPFLVGGTGLYIDAVIYDYNFDNDDDDRTEMSSDYIVVGITTDRGVLRDRITKRANAMFDTDIVKETTLLAGRYSWDSEPMKSNIYPIVWKMIKGEIDTDEAKKLFVFDDWHLAKRQMTWFKRNPNIIWLSLDDAKKYISDLLENKNVIQ